MISAVKRKTASGAGLIIGIPTLGRPVPLEWALAFKSMNPPINYNHNTLIVCNKAIADARNEICQAAVDGGHRYIFFLGDDVVPPPNILRLFVYRMEHHRELGVVSGVYCSKSEPPSPLVFRDNGRGSYWKWKVGEYFKVTGIGMDCALIRTEILKDVPKPWFKTINTDGFDDAIDKADHWTEDLYFCHQVLEHTKYEIYCDGSILCPHWDVWNNKAYNLPISSYPMQRMERDHKKKKLALDIGFGGVNRADQLPSYQIVTVDIRDETKPDYRCDVRKLPFDNKHFDLVFASHILEHFDRREWNEVLLEWIRVLKVGGIFELIVPNIEWAAEQLIAKKRKKRTEGTDIDMLNVLYGGQSNDFDFHKTGFWPQLVESILKKTKLKDIKLETKGYNIFARAKKVK